MLVYSRLALLSTAIPQEALESEVTVDDSQWLTYWLLSAVITLIERVFSPAIPYIPLYPIIKCAFLCWLVLPQTKGTEALYRQARPGLLFLKHHFDLILGKDVATATSGVLSVSSPTCVFTFKMGGMWGVCSA